MITKSLFVLGLFFGLQTTFSELASGACGAQAPAPECVCPEPVVPGVAKWVLMTKQCNKRLAGQCHGYCNYREFFELKKVSLEVCYEFWSGPTFVPCGCQPPEGGDTWWAQSISCEIPTEDYCHGKCIWRQKGKPIIQPGIKQTKTVNCSLPG